MKLNLTFSASLSVYYYAKSIDILLKWIDEIVFSIEEDDKVFVIDIFLSLAY